MFFDWFEGPEGSEKMLETCSCHPDLVVCHNSCAATSYYYKTYLNKQAIFTCFFCPGRDVGTQYFRPQNRTLRKGSIS